MKKFLIKFVPLLFVSCSQFSDPVVSEDNFNGKSFDSTIRTESEAIALVSELNLSTSTDSRSYQKVVDKTNISKIYTNKGSRSEDELLMYVVPFAESNGYVFVSADTKLIPILGIIDDGEFNEEKIRKI